MDQICISREEAAKAVGLSLRGVDYLISQGKINASRVGRRVLIPCAEIEKFVRNHNHLGPIPPAPEAGETAIRIVRTSET